MDPPEALLDYPNWSLELGKERREYEVQCSGQTSGHLTVKLKGVEDRDVAARLTGASILIRRALLPPRGDKEYYRTDLIGCEVQTASGRLLGTVQYFVETPAHALMVVVGSTDTGRTEMWVPAMATHIRRVDLSARKVIVDWEEGDE